MIFKSQTRVVHWWLGSACGQQYEKEWQERPGLETSSKERQVSQQSQRAGLGQEQRGAVDRTYLIRATNCRDPKGKKKADP